MHLCVLHFNTRLIPHNSLDKAHWVHDDAHLCSGIVFSFFLSLGTSNYKQPCLSFWLSPFPSFWSFGGWSCLSLLSQHLRVKMSVFLKHCPLLICWSLACDPRALSYFLTLFPFSIFEQSSCKVTTQHKQIIRRYNRWRVHDFTLLPHIHGDVFCITYLLM